MSSKLRYIHGCARQPGYWSGILSINWITEIGRVKNGWGCTMIQRADGLRNGGRRFNLDKPGKPFKTLKQAYAAANKFVDSKNFTD